MKAVVLEKRGKDGIRIGNFADPECPTGNAVIRVKAAALNHVDLYMRDSGKGITHELPMVLGLDAAGEIVEADPLSGLKPGMAVMTYPMEFCGTCEYCQAGEQPFCSNLRIIGEQRHGTYGEYLSARAGCFLPIPDNLDWRQAAALPTAYMTAWRMVFGKSPLGAGETVLIHGIGGGVALAALQFATMTGARAIVTSGSDEKLAKAKALGADQGINYSHGNVWPQVLEMTQGRGVDMVIENVGEATWDDSLRAARRGGRIIVCGATTGGRPPADLQRIFVRQLQIFGSTAANMAEYRALLGTVEQGLIKPVIDSVYGMDDALDALDHMEGAKQFGKIVLDIG
ncbi:MAG: zinc-binding dehydrogenase [Alphaproteobacteria bacterium]|nr:zinc-binding dehydrogenase [Alphaproteobacteria bacterium]